MFRAYRSNIRALKDDYNFPSVSAVDFSRIAIQTDKSRNVQEDKVINYADRKTKIFGEVFIVEETLQWFRLEGHGRERFIQHFLIENNGWVSTELHCCIARSTLAVWRKDVFEKAETVGKWIGYFA
jgi:hypothetical protein